MVVEMGVVDKFLHGRRFVRVSLGQLLSYSRAVANEVRRKYGRPSQIVYIERGGMIAARLLSDMLGVKDVAGVRAGYYIGIARRAKRVKIGAMPALRKSRSYILLVDDVADTGKTLASVSAQIRKRYRGRVVTCTIFYKPRSAIRPDIYAKKVADDKWIIFEYESNEFKKRANIA